MEAAYRNLSDRYSQQDRAGRRVEAEIAGLRAPQLNLPVFDVLPSGYAERSGAAHGANTFVLPEAGRFALVLSGAARRISADYAIVFFDEHTRTVYSGEGLKPDQQGNLLMTIDRTFLPAGRYRVEIGEKAGAASRPVATYFIRLVDQRTSPKIEKPAQ